ncbi:hypothetical protein HMPREF3293_00970 [Christensenella minuta]|uniref:Uncharacterized protein n=1 Tax=Christensenella minuta TaxID=626937 RepID=A0A136Q6D6_9FIRM|nr:hypothetical protein HMPREF3293_00970 [Christensenella minuta]
MADMHPAALMCGKAFYTVSTHSSTSLQDCLNLRKLTGWVTMYL